MVFQNHASLPLDDALCLLYLYLLVWQKSIWSHGHLSAEALQNSECNFKFASFSVRLVVIPLYLRTAEHNLHPTCVVDIIFHKSKAFSELRLIVFLFSTKSLFHLLFFGRATCFHWVVLNFYGIYCARPHERQTWCTTGWSLLLRFPQLAAMYETKQTYRVYISIKDTIRIIQLQCGSILTTIKTINSHCHQWLISLSINHYCNGDYCNILLVRCIDTLLSPINKFVFWHRQKPSLQLENRPVHDLGYSNYKLVCSLDHLVSVSGFLFCLEGHSHG